MKEIDIVARKAKELGITTTKMQYVLMSKLMSESSVDVSPEDCKRICNLQRYCRMLLHSDEVAIELEKKWKSQPVALFNLESHQMVDRLTGDKY
jgi:hypothetical protein